MREDDLLALARRVLDDTETRTVHAQNDDLQVVRYHRACKWAVEPTSPRSLLPRRSVLLPGAADAAVEVLSSGGIVHFGLRGGRYFDWAVQKRLRALGIDVGHHGATDFVIPPREGA